MKCNKRKKDLEDWAVENVFHRSHNRSTEGGSFYLTGIGGGNVTLRISDHLRLEYGSKVVSVLFNFDGSICAVYGTKLLPLKDVGEAKRFIRDFEFLSVVQVRKMNDEKYSEFCRVSNTPEYAALKRLDTKAKRRKAAQYLQSLADAPPDGDPCTQMSTK